MKEDFYVYVWTHNIHPVDLRAAEADRWPIRWPIYVGAKVGAEGRHQC